MTKQLKCILLILWFIVCAFLYYLSLHFEFGAIVIIYGIMSIVFGVGFFLVNGGMRPIIKIADQETEKITTRKQIKRNKYKKETLSSPREDQTPRANIFGLTPQKQKLYAELLLILFLPPTAVLVADYVLIAFLPGYN